jgi:hypothetical protein
MRHDDETAFGYVLKHEPKAAGGYQAFALFSCRRCSETLRINLRQGIKVHNPEFLARKARDAGWQAHPFKPNRSRCAACLASESTDRHEPSILTALPVLVREITPSQEEETMAAKQSIVAQLNASTDLTAPARATASETKMKIRNMLDKHFADDKGAYLDGYSDQRIGVELGVPWKEVADLREVAYGPIKEDPELTAVKTAVELIQQRMDEKVAEFATWKSGVMTQLAELRRRLASAGK